MKPAWDKLAANFTDSETVLIADVDCTQKTGGGDGAGGGKDLCEKIGVEGYPALMHGFSPVGPSYSLSPYTGGRELGSLMNFIPEIATAGSIEPCTPQRLDLCDDASKAQIEKYSKMSDAEFKAALKEKTYAVDFVKHDFKVEVEEMMLEYLEAQKKKDDETAAARLSGSDVAKSCLKYKTEKLEL